MTNDPVARLRRFNRAVTRETGALDTSFLGRGRPLGAARVLNAIGHGRSEVGTLRSYLGLDSGLLSRLLRGLEDEGLIVTEPHADDARRRVARLTTAGAREFAAYETLSDTQGRELLGRHPNPDALLAAMDLIATAFGRDRITIVETDPQGPDARVCLDAYFAELSRRFETGFDPAQAAMPDPAALMRPRGAFFVAHSDGLPIGCVGLKGEGNGTAEIKRLFVAPPARGLGLAQRLMDEAEATAKDLSITVLRLDTNRALPEAARFYRRAGWAEIARYNDNPYADFFFEKRLAAPFTR
ncbi:bifunctional helix-turn-helix transcriptional regulator/GNAT family N-acetyltransferase [Tanticharoenia sakaeratensis]|uniref:Transcriptional regulator n=1 Tax=Tanticharoenia sakaeratensis NBRC 103193 TaxID=1231623 RepID=A0A0D6MLR6_9PROT|nr:bifunctional helix-turn-helix transcriptional regulator/GNAT family N-acetyltransferase [Tanticharoenia sakaeratensis]GAN54355.1 transcriptional regulator [Tanticharoenia sakaeratensis NBRC 103193]GBQ18851.1 putative MarR family transcriptional regulator [Tanticharoenia sakaeratensis NBRC 103193]